VVVQLAGWGALPVSQHELAQQTWEQPSGDRWQSASIQHSGAVLLSPACSFSKQHTWYLWVCAGYCSSAECRATRPYLQVSRGVLSLASSRSQAVARGLVHTVC
jgi:hypothetical protein